MIMTWEQAVMLWLMSVWKVVVVGSFSILPVSLNFSLRAMHSCVGRNETECGMDGRDGGKKDGGGDGKWLNNS